MLFFNHCCHVFESSCCTPRYDHDDIIDDEENARIRDQVGFKVSLQIQLLVLPLPLDKRDPSDSGQSAKIRTLRQRAHQTILRREINTYCSCAPLLFPEAVF